MWGMRNLTFLAVLVASPAAAATDLAQVESLIARSTDEFRIEQGRARLAVDPALARAARGFADFMARTDQYGHTADGKEPAQRAREHGYDYCMVSENIANQTSSEPIPAGEVARLLVEGWKHSPGHRKNLLEPFSVDTGIAVARSARSGRIYAVQMFGRQRSRMLEFRVTNKARRAIAYRVADKDWSLQPDAARVHKTCVPEEVVFPDAAHEKGRMFRPSGGENLVVSGDRRVVVEVR
jgi:uncharacterized protein YkwD